MNKRPFDACKKDESMWQHQVEHITVNSECKLHIKETALIWEYN